MNHLGTRMRTVMSSRGQKRTQLADSIGMDACQVGRYLSGNVAPRADVLRRICDALNCSADYLIGRSDKP